MEPDKIALAVITLLGLIPVVIQYREESKLFAVGYGMLVVAVLSTNLEGLFLEGLLNLTEHGVGLMGAGIAFFAAAYSHRRQRIEGGAADDG